MIYLIFIFGILVVIAFVVSLYLFFRDKQHSRKSSGKSRPPRVPSYELYTWIDKEVSSRKLYRVPGLSGRELARELGMTERQLKKAIIYAYDKTVFEYLNERRVQAACRLLREQGNMSVEEVSLETGFTSLSAFQDVFKRIMGQTPNAYREQMIQSNKSQL